MFLLIYYAAAAFFTIYYAVTFKNPDGLNYTTSQVNGLNTWFWTADILALILVGILSDRLRVRKPLMVIGTIGAIATLIVFLSYATNPHTGYYTLALTSSVLAVFLSLAYAPWMAGYTETVEAKNPALVATGLALWGWILRLVVGISFIFLPIVITSVNPVVDNNPYASPPPAGVAPFNVQQFNNDHAASVAFATAHQALLTKIEPYNALLVQAASHPTGAVIAELTKDLGPVTLAQVLHYQKQLTTLVQPYTSQLNYLAAHQTQLTAPVEGPGAVAQAVAALVLDRHHRDGRVLPDHLADQGPLEPPQGQGRRRRPRQGGRRGAGRPVEGRGRRQPDLSLSRGGDGQVTAPEGSPRPAGRWLWVLAVAALVLAVGAVVAGLVVGPPAPAPPRPPVPPAAVMTSRWWPTSGPQASPCPGPSPPARRR